MGKTIKDKIPNENPARSFDEKEIDLHIAEYNALTTRSTYFFPAVVGVPPTVNQAYTTTRESRRLVSDQRQNILVFKFIGILFKIPE